MRRIRPTEEQICAAFMDLVRANTPRYPALERLYHIPNEGLRTLRQQRVQKRIGIKPGMPDYHLPVARNFHGWWCEMKRPSERPRESQRAVLQDLLDEGHYVCVHDDAEEAFASLICYLEKRPMPMHRPSKPLDIADIGK